MSSFGKKGKAAIEGLSLVPPRRQSAGFSTYSSLFWTKMKLNLFSLIFLKVGGFQLCQTSLDPRASLASFDHINEQLLALLCDPLLIGLSFSEFKS